MSQRPVAARYAQALLERVSPADLEAVDGSLSNLLSALMADTATRVSILSPVVPVEAKRQALRATVTGGFHPEAGRFVDYLLSKGRASILCEVLLEWNALLRERKGEIEVKVVTAAAMQAPFLEKVKAHLEKKTGKICRLLATEDASLLGGFQIFYQNKVVDASLKGRLSRLKENLSAQN